MSLENSKIKEYLSSKIGSPDVAALWDSETGSWQYIVSDPATGHALIIDPVWDFDRRSGRFSTVNADMLLDYVRRKGLTLTWVLDTHPHADHMTAAAYIAKKMGVFQGIGIKVLEIQEIWADYYAQPGLRAQPQFWDRLFDEGMSFHLGSIDVDVWFSPGHTLGSVTYKIADAVFAHDTLMMPDSGSARADFPGGSAVQQWESIKRIVSLPKDTRIFVGHDYGKEGRASLCMATVEEHLRSNIHVVGQDAASFVALREARDKTLPLPDLMLYALQVNLRGGRLPESDSQGNCVLRVPVNRF